MEASHGGWTQDYGQMSFLQQDWSTIGAYTQPYYTGTIIQDDSPVGAAVLEVPPASSTPSWCEPHFLQRDRTEPSVYWPQTNPVDCWGGHQSGSLTSTFHTVRVLASSSPCNFTDTSQDVQTPYHPSVDSSGAGTIQTYRYSPYETPHSQSNKYTDMGAGPSYSVLQATPHVTCPPANPSGGSSEATADAETPLIITEEEETSVSNFYCSHVPHVTEWVFDVRRQPRQIDGGPSMRET